MNHQVPSLVLAVHHKKVGHALQEPRHGELQADVASADDEMRVVIAFLHAAEGLDTMKNLRNIGGFLVRSGFGGRVYSSKF